jgi:glycosyltransferase involved in cell wall biosynthesis
MPALTALLHTENDALRLGRCLETLYPCDEILIVDHGSRDGTVQLAREYGARVFDAKSEAKSKTAIPPEIRALVRGWILCLDPRESLTESLAASLFEWKSEWPAPSRAAFSVFLREETTDGWVQNPAPQTRLVPSDWNRWQGRFPMSEPSALALEGELLSFVFP